MCFLAVKAQQYFVILSCMLIGEKTVLEIWLNAGLYLTIFRGAGPRVLNALPRLSKKRIYPSWPLGINLRSIMRSNYFLPEVEGFCW